MRKLLSVAVAILLSCCALRAQFTDCGTGLLQIPTAEMQPDGMFMITNHWLNKHSLPSSGWNYRTFQYGFSLSFWDRFEIGYVCTIYDGKKTDKEAEYWKDMFNQDRHFSARALLLRENEFGLSWMPAMAVGISDPVTGVGGDYLNGNVNSTGNGYFNRAFVVFTKHFQTPWGALGVHAGYQYSVRSDYRINAPCAGVNWRPAWLLEKGVLDGVDLIAEFDSRTLNVGAIASVWDNRFEAMVELQNFQWLNFGMRYKLKIKK